MDIPPAPDDDILAQPIRERLFQALAQLRRPATTQELAARVGRHPNTVRVQLQRLCDVGLLERRDASQPRGRPRQEWVIAATARPAGLRPHLTIKIDHTLRVSAHQAAADEGSSLTQVVEAILDRYLRHGMADGDQAPREGARIGD